MDPVTHVVTGVALSQMVPAPARGLAALAGVAYALLPDLDYLLVYHDRLAFLRHHRGFTHSLAGLVLFACLGAGLGRLLGGPRWTRPIFLIGLLVLASHLFLDLATSYGTQILNPFSRTKFTLDWLFIIDPVITALMAVAALSGLFFGGGSRSAPWCFLSLAVVYVLLCGFYHHQALALARQIFPAAESGVSLAALPQPFSFRRWQLLAATPQGIRQAFVELPYLPMSLNPPPPREIEVRLESRSTPRVPPTDYRPLSSLEIFRWSGASPQEGKLSPESRSLLKTYLDFARFPLWTVKTEESQSQTLVLVDLRFSVPGRPLPFVLRLKVNQEGRPVSWDLSHSSRGRLAPIKSGSP
jgi:membrane-bound metal-dependent hydrolase YbcI (DUF457 family)